MPPKQPHGFTLAELLIALMILGEIATFTIPKVLSSQTNARNNAVVKEALAAASNAVYLANMNNVLTTSSTMGNLTQYLNYVATDSTTTIDGVPSGSGPLACGSYACLKLHSGALFLYSPSTTFTTTSGYITAVIDPDGRQTSLNDSLGIAMYYNGKVISYGEQYGASYSPSWFSW